MSPKMPILESEPLTLTVGPTRRNHRLELFFDSDREVLAGRVSCLSWRFDRYRGLGQSSATAVLGSLRNDRAAFRGLGLRAQATRDEEREYGGKLHCVAGRSMFERSDFTDECLHRWLDCRGAASSQPGKHFRVNLMS
jgi:hypothetical protein